MIRTKLLLAVFTVISVSGSPVAAESASLTPVEHWTAESPIIISAYQRNPSDDTGNNGGIDLQLLEIFNNSEELIDVTKWGVEGTFESTVSGATVAEVASLSIQYRDKIGYLAPGKHASVSISDDIDINNSSYISLGWKEGKPIGILTQLSLVPSDKTIKRDTYTLKTQTTKIISKTVTLYGDFWRRVPTDGVGYLSSFYATTVLEGGLYDDGLYTPPEAPKSRIIEVYHHSETCAASDGRTECGDYIKLQIDPGDELDKIVVRTDNSSSSRTTTNTFSLEGRMVSPEGYMTIIYSDTDARLDLTDSGGTAWLEELYGNTPYVDTTIKYDTFTDGNKNWSYILDGTWQWTTTPQPGLPNKLTMPVVEIPTCSEGKYLNPDTGRCRTIEEAVNALATCSEGQERNPATNRCRSKVLAASTTLASCGEGQERNPATNRCRSIATAVAELLPCDEGYERNPATNRCRRVVALVDGIATTPAQLVEQAKGSGLDMWTWALVAVGATGAVGYGAYEWRHELLGFGQKIASRFGKK